MTVFTGPSQLLSPHHCLGLHNIPDGDVFEQLARTIAEYEPINHYPSVHPATSSTIIRVVGSLQVNKELPPLPTQDSRRSSGIDPISSEDESQRWDRPLHPPYKPQSQAFRAKSHSSTSSSLSINAPPSLGSRTSALSGTETCTSILNSNFGTSRSNSLSSVPPSAPFAGSRCYSPSSGRAAQLLAVPEGQSWSDAEAESSNLTRPPSPLLQNATHNHLLRENPLIKPSSPLRISHLVSGDSDPLGSEKPPRSREALLVFDGDWDSPDSVTSPVIEWKPLIPTPPATPSPLKSDLKSSRKRTLSSESRSVPRLPSQLQAPPPPKHPPRKRQRTEGHGHLFSPPDLISFSPDLRDNSNNRTSRDRHHLPRVSPWSSYDETSSSLSTQPVCESSIVSASSLPVEWAYPLFLTLEELFKGGTYTYHVTTRLLSGKPKTREVRVNVMPGWATGTRINFPNAGHECAPGIFQKMVFVVQQVDHKRFTRREGGNLAHDQDISLSYARKTNETRPPRRVVGLDGKVIEFYPPRGAIWHGQEMTIKGQGMHKRSKGKVVGRGDLIVRWNITP